MPTRERRLREEAAKRAKSRSSSRARPASRSKSSRSKSSDISVNVYQGQMKEIKMNGSKTVSDALKLAGYDAEGYDVRLNGEIIDNLNVKPKNGDTIFLVESIEGN